MRRKRRAPPLTAYSPGPKRRKATEKKQSSIVLQDFIQNFQHKIKEENSVKHLAKCLNNLEREYIEDFSNFWKTIQTSAIGDVFHGQGRMEIQQKFKKLQKRREEVKLGRVMGKLESVFAADQSKRSKIKPRIDNSLKERISKEKARQRLRASTKAPVEKNTAQLDNGKKFWQMFEPLFEFQDVNTLRAILQRTLNESKPFLLVPPFGDMAKEIQANRKLLSAEHGPSYGFEEEIDTRWEKHTPSCPYCERGLQLQVLEHRWSCDHFNHFGHSTFQAGERAYSCPHERCHINICMQCFNRRFEHNEEQDRMRSFRLKSASSLLMNAFIQPGASWHFQDEGTHRNQMPTASGPPPRLKHKPKPSSGKSSTKHKKFTLEQCVQMELKELGLFDTASDYKPEKREDDEICLFLREKHDILQEQLTRVKQFYQKIQRRCESHAPKARKLKQLREAEEDFLRVSKDPTKTEEELLEALEKFEALERSVGTTLENLVQTPWMRKFN